MSRHAAKNPPLHPSTMIGGIEAWSTAAMALVSSLETMLSQYREMDPGWRTFLTNTIAEARPKLWPKETQGEAPMSDSDPTQLMRDLRGMTGTDHVGRTAHDAVTEIERLMQVRDALLSALKAVVCVVDRRTFDAALAAIAKAEGPAA